MKILVTNNTLIKKLYVLFIYKAEIAILPMKDYNLKLFFERKILHFFLLWTSRLYIMIITK